LELFELSRPNRRRSSEFSARSANISALSEAIKSTTSAGSVIPPLIQIRAAKSPKARNAKQIHQTCAFFDSPRLGSYFSDQNMLQLVDLKRFLIARMIPSERKAR
jgi:hypothetical protein